MNDQQQISEFDKLCFQETELKKKLASLPREKWKIYKLFIAAPICIFVGPYIPMKRGSLESRMGYHDAVLMFTIMWIILIPIVIYSHFNKVDDQIFSTELELDEIERKINDIKSVHSL